MMICQDRLGTNGEETLDNMITWSPGFAWGRLFKAAEAMGDDVEEEGEEEMLAPGPVERRCGARPFFGAISIQT